MGGTAKDTVDSVRVQSAVLKESWVDQTRFETHIQTMNIMMASRRWLREETRRRLISWNKASD